KQMLSYKKLYNVILRAEKGETYNSIKNRYSLGFLEETDLGSKMEIEFQTDSFEILSKQLIEYGSGIEIVQPDELKCITRKHLAQITNHCLNLI
ncbi:WYL domain-containing protein, partial [Enterococcus faecium]